jgi:hypothetical protein
LGLPYSVILKALQVMVSQGSLLLRRFQTIQTRIITFSVSFVAACRLAIHFFSYLEAIPRLSTSSMLHRLVILPISVLCINVKMLNIHEAVGNIDVQLGGLQATRASHWARLPDEAASDLANWPTWRRIPSLINLDKIGL